MTNWPSSLITGAGNCSYLETGESLLGRLTSASRMSTQRVLRYLAHEMGWRLGIWQLGEEGTTPHRDETNPRADLGLTPFEVTLLNLWKPYFLNCQVGIIMEPTFILYLECTRIRAKCFMYITVFSQEHSGWKTVVRSLWTMSRQRWRKVRIRPDITHLWRQAGWSDELPWEFFVGFCFCIYFPS